MAVKIVTDINYHRSLLAFVFKCSICGKELLMFGCPDPNCKNYYKLRMSQYPKITTTKQRRISNECNT